MRIGNVLYMPQSKWKAGERRAFRSCMVSQADRVVPAFKITPSGSFDPDEQRVLTATEYMARFGQQLAESWGRRLAFIDAELIDDDRHKNAAGVHPLTELMERARLAGASAAPIFSPTSSPEYLAAVRRYVARDEEAISCLRLSLSDLEYAQNADELSARVFELGSRPSSTVLLIDGGPLQIDDPEDLAHLLASQMGRLIRPGEWLRVFWSTTSFPEKSGLRAGMVGLYPRKDWFVYEAILKHKDEFPIVPMFSDYMLEYPSNYSPAPVSPTAKLRYSTEADYVYFMGRSTKVENKYRNIFPVAEKLVSHEVFKGPDYSIGNAYIARLAAGCGKTGNASMWRWASTDHHLNLVDDQLCKAFGISRERASIVPSAEQLQLV